MAPRLTHKQLLHELKTVMYPVTGLDTKRLRACSKKLQDDPDITMKCIGNLVERACNMMEKPEVNSMIL